MADANMCSSSSFPKRKKVNFLEEFLEEVRNYRLLYDKSEPQYKDIALKQAIWGSIGSKFNMTAEECERKFKVQRDRYCREKKKLNSTKTSGAGNSEVYKIKWELYDTMDSILRGCSRENESSFTNVHVPPENNENEDIISGVMSMDSHTRTEEACESSFTVDEEMSEAFLSPESHPGPSSTLSNILQHSPTFSNITNVCTDRPGRKRNKTGIEQALIEVGEMAKIFKSHIQVQKPDDRLSRYCSYFEERMRRLDVVDRNVMYHIIDTHLLQIENQDKYLNKL